MESAVAPTCRYRAAGTEAVVGSPGGVGAARGGDMKGVYYNDNEAFVCDWLENLIAAKLIPAGVGGWAYGLQLAGWGDRAVWTGSCPCPAFSVAGRGRGFSDPRHLWPEWLRLIRECRPPVVFGEQVEGAVGHGWLDLVSTDMEAQGYAFAAAVLGAHSAGAAHLRQRLWFVAHSGTAAPVANAPRNGRQSRRTGHTTQEQERGQPCRGRESRSLPAPVCERGNTGRRAEQWEAAEGAVDPAVGRVADGIPGRVGLLRGLGNAVVPQVAATFVRAYLECASGRLAEGGTP